MFRIWISAEAWDIWESQSLHTRNKIQRLLEYLVLPSEVPNSRSSSRERSCVSCPGEKSDVERHNNKIKIKTSWGWCILTSAALFVRKPSSVKLLCLQRFLCALLSRPSGVPACYFCPTEKRSVPVAPQRTVCNRTPHCRAAPQTMCLRSSERETWVPKRNDV